MQHSKHNFKQARRTMSQPAAVCRNKVQAELKAEIKSLSLTRVFCHDITEEECKEDSVCRNKVQAELKAEIKSLSLTSVFCHDITEEECKEDCRDTLNSVTKMIKANGKGTLSRQS